MQEVLKQFSDYLLVKKGLGQVTIRGYMACLSVMLKRIGNINPTETEVDNYIIWLHENKYSYSHIVNSSLAVEWYFKFQNKHLQLGRPRKPRPIIKDTLTEAEITNIISNSKNIREKAIVTLLSYSGIRNSELCNLKVYDIDLGNNTVRVIKGKGSKDRIVQISGDCTSVLIQYLYQFPRNSDDYLFTTLRDSKRYTEYALRKLVKVLSRRANISKRVYPHLFRHSLATNLIKRGCGLNLVQRQMGHEFIESTMIYIKSYPQRIQNEYNLYIPSYI